MMKRRKIQKFIGLVCGIVIMLCPTTLFAEPTEESNVKYKNRTYYSDVYCAGHDDDFSKQENIDSDDYNYGWKLGEFCVSGYSSHVTDGEGNYVFLKNAGDKITLSFILEQKDIHCLDGKSELYIRELSSRDEYFQTQKLDFGHGAMILRYTDSENKKHDPEIYTNYLEALEVGNENMISVEGPDTTSYLLEEGDYEVALDYRVAKEKNGPLFINPKDKYQDYRIFFKFSIRNGNCMSFIRDVTTGNELTNENVTKDGFIVDMANSKYLQVNIKKEVLSKGKNGLVEDTRFNKPVSDGEKFTDEGVYTLTTKNVYTEQTTVKRIYVGSNKVMIAYVNSQYSIKEINNLLAQGCTINDDGTIEYPVTEEVTTGTISTPSEATSTNTINVSDEKLDGNFLEKIVNEIKNKPYKWTGIASSVVLLLALLLCVKLKKRKKTRKEVTIEDVEDADSLDE